MQNTLETFTKCLKPYAKQKLWNKAFCIGSHKTGTTSLNLVMKIIGFDCAPQHEIEISTVDQVQHGIYRELFKKVEWHCSNLKKNGHDVSICMLREDPGMGIFIPEIDRPILDEGKLADGCIPISKEEN